MLRALVAKDLRRAWRNPLPWLLNLALPLSITAVIGLVFGGGGGDNSQIGRIKFAVVDEDQSAFSRFLRGGAGQGKAGQYLEPVYLERDAAMRQLNDSKLSAVLVIPAHFTSNYLTGGNVALELVKNPAEQIHPAILEELLGVIVSGLNALSRNVASEFPAWQRVVDGDVDYHEVSRLIEDEGNKLKVLRRYVFPPLVGYTNVVEKQPSAATPKPAGAKFDIFAFMLPGLAAMFLLMLAAQAVNDLHRELALRTFERFNTLREHLLVFVAAKGLYTFVATSIAAAILLCGGAMIFRFSWPRPLEMTFLTLAYVFFATGLMSTIVALMPDERRANAMNSVVSMVLAMAGGAMFPADELPAALQQHLLPLMPTYWYVNTARDLWWGQASWPVATAKLLALGAAGLVAATFLFQRRLSRGERG
jgi:ABC-type polysaccharide/polyol phosphate export permease